MLPNLKILPSHSSGFEEGQLVSEEQPKPHLPSRPPSNHFTPPPQLPPYNDQHRHHPEHPTHHPPDLSRQLPMHSHHPPYEHRKQAEYMKQYGYNRRVPPTREFHRAYRPDMEGNGPKYYPKQAPFPFEEPYMNPNYPPNYYPPPYYSHYYPPNHHLQPCPMRKPQQNYGQKPPFQVPFNKAPTPHYYAPKGENEGQQARQSCQNKSESYQQGSQNNRGEQQQNYSSQKASEKESSPEPKPPTTPQEPQQLKPVSTDSKDKAESMDEQRGKREIELSKVQSQLEELLGEFSCSDREYLLQIFADVMHGVPSGRQLWNFIDKFQGEMKVEKGYHVFEMLDILQLDHVMADVARAENQQKKARTQSSSRIKKLLYSLVTVPSTYPS